MRTFPDWEKISQWQEKISLDKVLIAYYILQ